MSNNTPVTTVPESFYSKRETENAAERNQRANNYRTYMVIYDKKWYYRLVTNDEETEKERGIRSRALMVDYPLNQLDGKLVVSLITQNNIRLFTVFESYVEFAHYNKKFLPDKRSFFEVAIGDFPQKIHFDIDLSQDDLTKDLSDLNLEVLGNMLRDSVTREIIEIFKEWNLSLDLTRDFLIYTSHGTNKRSYHIVVNGYCHYNNKEAKAFYEYVMNRISGGQMKFKNKSSETEKQTASHVWRYLLSHPYFNGSTEKLSSFLRKVIDHSVYSPKQQFRIIGSQKLGSGRPKRFDTRWTFENQTIEHRYIEPVESPEHEFILQLEESLISYVSNCSLLPSLIDENGRQSGNAGVFDNRIMVDNISMNLAVRALELCATTFGISTSDHRFPYKILGIRGIIVMLKRLKPSICRICGRRHEHENPYLFLTGAESEGYTVYFDCRRADGKKLLVGKLEPTQSPSPNTITNINETSQQWCSSVVDRIMKMSKMPISGREIKLPATHITLNTKDTLPIFAKASVTWYQPRVNSNNK
jgi:hypothetical protein